MSLKKRITLTICSITIFLLILLSFIVYTRSASILNDDARNYMVSQLERVQENIDLLIKNNELETQALALNQKTIAFMENKVSVRYMNHFLIEEMRKKNERYHHYMDLFILNNDGRIVATCMPEAMHLDLSTRAYFIKASQIKDTVVSDILRARSDQSLIVITVSPIRNLKDEVLGYAGIAIKAGYFSNIARDLKLGKTGYYAIVDANNMILFHPKKELIGNKSIYEMTEKILMNVNRKDINIVEKTIFKNNQSKELQIYKLMKSKNWILIASLSEKEMYEKSKELLIYVASVGLIVIFISIIMGIYISNRIAVPIVAITNYINKAANGNSRIEKSIYQSIQSLREEELLNVNSEKEQNSRDEIRNLKTSLKNMKAYLTSMLYKFESESKELIKTSQDLTKKIEDLSSRTADFISILSHDLKTSITLIKGYARGLHSGIIEDEITKRQFLEGIIGGVEDIEKITCDILDNAYEAQCSKKFNKKKIMVKDFTKELFQEAKQYVINSNRVFEGVYKVDEGYFFIEAIKIKRVWNNLLNNAVKYSEEGSKINVCICEEEKKVQFKIADEGIGIDENEMNNIFDMFYRGDNHVKKGYGLGLFISKSIIEAHNAKLYVKSRYKKGATFWFYLDVEDE
ncbi:sensor histidine kinase [Crassaminicella thermophila]|uniref:histidine kinase n=1 Tax=Crassaminicella thermophila TaxID=2599308 RepID=A0A5C0SA32_CRATE|nr:sensor histidine kinase [Crassaminicella thermophila]QEK10981.1 sensor histidine kinase [Crassaminicella thermophila]